MMTIALIPLLLMLSGEGPFGGADAVPAPTAPESPAPEWPKKGDTVYVSAKLAAYGGLGYVGVLALASPRVEPLDPCAPLEVKIRSIAHDRITVVDDTSVQRVLRGDWSERLHRTEKECRDVLASQGPARVRSEGVFYRLVK